MCGWHRVFANSTCGDQDTELLERRSGDKNGELKRREKWIKEKTKGMIETDEVITWPSPDKLHVDCCCTGGQSILQNHPSLLFVAC